MRVGVMVILAIASIVLVSCATKAGQRPDWISGSTNQSSSYLTGLGSGASQEIAADRARNDLAKIIGVTIEGFERSKTSNSAEGYDSSFSSAVNTRVSQTLSGVTITERYYD
ncbi:MAG: LPP20 family lipoprotein, partial [Helicobacteraceae bacterium]|nr:LPP20 family lipoprotein [Helicobacteraceae bacterium]